MAYPAERDGVTISARVCAVFGLTVLWAAGYFALGSRAASLPSFTTEMQLDSHIPFQSWAVWPYMLGILGIGLPAWSIRPVRLFRSAVVAYTIVICVSFLFFFVFPTASPEVRVYAAMRDTDAVTAWMVATLWSIDQPTNLAPSLHASLSTTAACALALATNRRRQRISIGAGWATVLMSVCVVKQHYVLDVVTGTLLGLCAITIASVSSSTPR